MNAYAVVEQFERELCAYTGAKYAVTTSNCTMAIQIAASWFRPAFFDPVPLSVPKRTYYSVPMALLHAGFKVAFREEDWRGEYRIGILPLWDSARRFTSGMYRPQNFQCVSFHTSKILGIEQGGAVLHDNDEADAWLRRARFHGRLNAAEKVPQQIGWAAYMSPSTAALALSRLSCLPRDNPDQAGAADFPDISELPIWR